MRNELSQFKLDDRVQHIRSGDVGIYQGVDADVPQLAWVLWDNSEYSELVSLAHLEPEETESDEDELTDQGDQIIPVGTSRGIKVCGFRRCTDPAVEQFEGVWYCDKHALESLRKSAAGGDQ